MTQRSKLRFDDEERDENSSVQAVDTMSDSAAMVYEVNSRSKAMQKRAIKKEYAAAKGARSTSTTTQATAKTAKNAAKDTETVGAFIAKNKTALLIIGVIIALLLVILTCISSCSLMLQSTMSGVTTTTYPVEDAEMLSCEESYSTMENELWERIGNYEAEHEYDEYHYVLDEIWHDPYTLISAVTSIVGGEWTNDEVVDLLSQIFDAQYTITETVIPETRYRTEPQIGYYVYVDPTTGQQQLIPYEYTTEVPYTYYICTVKLENIGLESAVESLMTDEQLLMYEVYMTTKGNKPDLFPTP